MAVTHDDLAPSGKGSELSSKSGAFLMVLTILLGLFCFILCLIAEDTRSELTWDILEKKMKSHCKYTSNGKLPLLSAAAAFFALAMAMLVHLTYLLVAVSKSDSLLEITTNSESDSVFSKAYTWQLGFFFLATWMTFSVGEIILLIGISVESGHLRNWAISRSSCLIVRQGLFTSAGVFGLLTVSLASGLYITALRAEMHFKERQNTRREIVEVSALYARSPRRINIRTVNNERRLPRQDQNYHTLYQYLTAFDKHSNLV